LWLAAEGYLLFNDLNSNTTHKLILPDTFSTYRKSNDRTNGMATDPDGGLVFCETDTGRVMRAPVDGELTVVADSFLGTRFTRPNDTIVRSDGTIYFSDSGKAVFRVDPANTVHLVSNGIRPNGVALSPDEQVLYASNRNAVWQFSVMTDGSTDGGSKLADTSGNVDGMGVDDAGNIYATVDAGLQIFKPNGTVWGTIGVPERPTNVSFGGIDRRTLFITASTGLYQVQTPIPGIP
jgi:gluconolactonase